MAKSGLTFLEFAQYCEHEALQAASGTQVRVDQARDTIKMARITLAAHQVSGFFGRATLAELTEYLIGRAGRQNGASLALGKCSAAYTSLALAARAMSASTGRADMLVCDLDELQRRVQLPAPLAA